MGTVIGLAVVGGCIWWIFNGRESTGAIVNNLLLAVVFGGVGVLLLAVGSGFWNVVLALGCIAYATRGLVLTGPWIRERMDPDGR